MTHTPTLKPCPFCGGDFKTAQEPYDNHPVNGLWYLFHKYGEIGSGARKCLIDVPKYFDTEAEAITAWNTRTVEAGGVQELAEALREIRDMKPREYTGPEFDREASDACPDCIKYQGHPIQQGICDEHRRPFYAREDHDKFEERAKGSRCYLIASAALSKWEASK